MEDQIKTDELIYLYHDDKARFLVRYQPEKKVNTNRGALVLSEGLLFGQLLYSSTGAAFYLLKPNTALISKQVERRTTILYPKDAGMALMELGVQSGSRVAEAGSGSGALSIILSRTAGTGGTVYSFERRQDFHELARENHERSESPDNVVFEHRDVETDGFGDISVDAIFIDVPQPWTLIGHAHAVLRGGHTLGSLSPNIEQVQKTHRAMQDTGFIRLRTYEILLREMRIRPERTRPKEHGIVHTGYLLFGEKIL